MDKTEPIWHPWRCETTRKGVDHLLGYMIRQIEADAKMSAAVRWEALESVIQGEVLSAVVQAHGIQRQRQRKLSAELGLMIVIALHLFVGCSLRQVLWKLMKGVMLIGPEGWVPATKGAISQVRYAVGARAMVDLFHRVCRPLAQPDTPGAFWKGWRLLGIDGTDEAVADTPANEGFFGRHTSGRGQAAFPQLRAIYLVELGTHAILDAGAWAIRRGERQIGRRMLRSLQADSLVLWDCGFHSFAMVKGALSRGAQVLVRLPANIQVQALERLSDGSTLIELVDRKHSGKAPDRLRLRLIEYTVTDPLWPGYGQRRRLITSLLDPHSYPALELAHLYHQRWEVEITIDETDTHQRRPLLPFRSLKPVGVIQEFYALLIAHYIVRKIMLDAAQQAHLDPDQLSFTNALQLIADAISDFQILLPEHHPGRYQRLLRDLACFCLPPRAIRSNPRVVKRKMSNFDKKRPEHRGCPQPARSFPEAIALI